MNENNGNNELVEGSRQLIKGPEFDTDRPKLPDFAPVFIFQGVDCSRCNHKALPQPNEVIICRSVGELFTTAKRFHKQAARTSTLICLDDQLIMYYDNAFVSTKALINKTIQRD